MADAPKDVDEKKMDGLLKKLLSTPPKPHKPKPEDQPAKGKPSDRRKPD